MSGPSLHSRSSRTKYQIELLTLLKTSDVIIFLGEIELWPSASFTGYRTNCFDSIKEA